MLTGPEKAVIFLLSLDEEVAGPIVAELREPELRRLRQVASTMREVQADAVDEAYREFLDRSQSAVAIPRGGLPYLRRLTSEAFGEARARDVFEDGVTSPLARLEAAPPDAVAQLLAYEPPQLAGAVLARLEPSTAAAIVASMPEDRQREVLLRVTRMTELPAGALEDVANALCGELPSPDAETLISVDGVAKVAQILNSAGKAAAAEIMEKMKQEDPELAQRVQLAMFTFDDLVRLDNKSMRTLLREVPNERLTAALKNSGEAVMNAVLRGLSQRAAELLRDDLELLSHIKKSEIELARREIIEIALRLESEGSLDLGREEE